MNATTVNKTKKAYYAGLLKSYYNDEHVFGLSRRLRGPVPRQGCMSAYFSHFQRRQLDRRRWHSGLITLW